MRFGSYRGFLAESLQDPCEVFWGARASDPEGIGRNGCSCASNHVENPARPPCSCRACMSWIISSEELFRASMLKVVHTVRSAALFVWKSFCVCWVVRANPREGSCSLPVQQYAIVLQPLPFPRAKLHSQGPSTSPCPAPRSLGIGWTPSSPKKERARCFHPATAG